MLRIQLDINGRRIESIGVHNTQEQRVECDDQDVGSIEVLYDVYDLTDVDDTVAGEDPITSLWFDRSKGASALTARVMEQIGIDPLDGNTDSTQQLVTQEGSE